MDMHFTRTSIAFSGCMVAGLLLSASGAHADLIRATLDGGLKENLDPEVKVSGGVIVGVMLASAYDGLSQDELAISPGVELDSGAICLQVSSRDGAYTSRNTYRLQDEATPDDSVELPYDSQYPDALADYDQERALAVSAMHGECGHSTQTTYYLPHWQKETEAGNVAIYINGFEATDVYYSVADDQDDMHDCTYIEEGQHTAFNFVCEIHEKGAIFRGEKSAVKVTIHREVYGRSLDDITITISGRR